MHVFGSLASVQFTFSEIGLESFQVQRHQKPSYAMRETLLGNEGLSPLPIAAPVKDEKTSLKRNFSNPLEWATQQNLGIGQRLIKVHQETEDEGTQTLSAKLLFHFNITGSLVWSSRFENCALAQVRKDSVRVELGNNTIVDIRTDRHFELQNLSDGSLTLDISLLAGSSEIEAVVQSDPHYAVSKTAVLCRPEQLEEAAVVLSCCDSEEYIPLVVIEEPPMPEDEYTSLYKKCTEAKQASLRYIGGMGLSGITSDESRIEALKRIDIHLALQEKLTPYRSWAKRNEGISRLLIALEIRRVVILFSEQEGHFLTSPPELKHEAFTRKAGPSIIPENGETVYILQGNSKCKEENEEVLKRFYLTIESLTEIAIQALGQNNVNRKQEFLRIPKGEVLGLLSGFNESLRHRIPIQIVSGADSPDYKYCLTSAQPSSTETVIVEATGKADDLVGILYAHYEGKSLVLSEAPDLGDVDLAIQEFNRRRAASAKASLLLEKLEDRETHPPNLTAEDKDDLKEIAVCTELKLWAEIRGSALVETLRKFVFGDWAKRAIERIEEAVSAQIPDFVPDSVEDNCVTVFTTGLPYSFLRTTRCNWERKPIGHIMEDSSLVVLREFYMRGAPRFVFGLSIILDSGFFKGTMETRGVFKSLEDHFTYPLILDGNAASLAGLQHLSLSEGLEFLFFNTHGSDHSISLGEQPLKNYGIPQWLAFFSNPVIFNNSCLSWRGVGREFVRVGARGYVGTLWSVNAKQASLFAQSVTRKIARSKVSIAEAISRSSVEQETRRSYIFIGTAGSHLDRWIEDSPESEWEYARTGLDFFLSRLEDSLSNLSEYQEDLSRLLYREVKRFVEHLECLPPRSKIDLFNARYKELSLVAHSAGSVLGTDEAYEEGLFSRCSTCLNSMELGAEVRNALEGSIGQFSAALKWRRGDLAGAASDLMSSTVSPELSLELYASAQNMLIEILKQAGAPKKAMWVAIQTKEVLEEHGAKFTIVPILGQICQLCKREGEFDQGLKYAREGFRLAAEVGEPERQPAFKLDEAQLLLCKEEWDQALEAAEWASAKFRVQHDPSGDVKAHGIIGNCLMHMGRISDSREVFTRGYEFSQEIGNDFEVAAFAADLGNIELREGNVGPGFEKFLKAIRLNAAAGHIESIEIVLYGMFGPCIELRDYELLGRVLTCQLLLVSHVGPELADLILRSSFSGIKAICGVEHSEKLIFSLGDAWNFGEAMADSGNIRITGHFKFMMALLELFTVWIKGESDLVLTMARKLDGASNSVLKLADFTSEPF